MLVVPKYFYICSKNMCQCVGVTDNGGKNSEGQPLVFSAVYHLEVQDPFLITAWQADSSLTETCNELQIQAKKTQSFILQTSHTFLLFCFD